MRLASLVIGGMSLVSAVAFAGAFMLATGPTSVVMAAAAVAAASYAGLRIGDAVRK